MSNRAADKTLAMFRESVAGTGPADWDVSGTTIRVIDPSVEEIVQTVIADENYQQDMNDDHEDFLGVKRPAFSFKMYVHGSPNRATAGNAATSIPLTEIFQNAWGGEHLGFATAAIGNTGSILQLPSGSWLYNQGDYIYLRDNSDSGRKKLFEIQMVLTESNQLYLDRAPSITVASGDTADAVITNYLNWDGLTDSSDANYDTHSWFFKMLKSDDMFEVNNSKCEIEFDEVSPNKPLMVSCKWLGTGFTNEGLTRPNLTTTPAGERPGIVGVGNRSTFLYGNATGSLSTLRCYKLSIKTGLTQERIEGVNGDEGQHQYFGKKGGLTVEAVFDYSSSYAEDFRNRINKRIMLQVEDRDNRATGLDFTSLQFAENPTRIDHNGISAVKCVFKQRERQLAASSSLGQDDVDKWRSPIKLLTSA